MKTIKEILKEHRDYDVKFNTKLTEDYKRLWDDFEGGEHNVESFKRFMTGLFNESVAYSENKTEVWAEVIESIAGINKEEK